jgi:ribosome-associated protein YbcJ (S4-like RNA binding protein)
LVNDEPETRKRRKLMAGDRVTTAGETVVVRVSASQAG